MKRELVLGEINKLQRTLNNIETYYKNFEQNQVLVNPQVKEVKPFEILHLEKEGTYAKIGQYCSELLSLIKNLPKQSSTLAVFFGEGYRPKRHKMWVGVVKNPKMKLTKEGKKRVKLATIPGYKALSYLHYGSGANLSMFWKELEKFASKKGF